MAQLKLTPQMDVRNQILVTSDTELRNILLAGWEILDFDTAILPLIQADLDLAALAAKKARLVEAADRLANHPALPGICAGSVAEVQSLDYATLALEVGRSRQLDAEAVFMLAMVRAHLDSVTSRAARDRIVDSVVMHSYFEARGMKMPSRSTSHMWINCIREATWERVLDSQLAFVLGAGLDDFRSVTADSFSVWADTAWPTDSAMIHGLLDRAWRRAGTISRAGFPSFTTGWVEEWIEQLRQLDRKISFTCGKSNSKKKRRALYTDLFDTAEKVLVRLDRQFEDLLPEWDAALGRAPLKIRNRLARHLDGIFIDLADTARVVAYARARVFDNESIPMCDKVLSLSDGSAAYIKKGQREPVIGYKPQVMRSSNGFVTAFALQQGNPSDAAQLLPLTRQHVARTGIVPGALSVDDGYSSGDNRRDLKEFGIAVVSMNGAKGKKITPVEEWNSAEYEMARDDRSAVESLVFTLRYKHHLYRFSRRGLENVRIEMFEKLVAHNLWRITLLRRRAAALENAA